MNLISKNITSFINRNKAFLMNALAVFICFSLVSVAGLQDAFASGSIEEEDSLIIMLCNVINYATGNAAKAVATIVLVAIGIGFFNGSISWTTLVGTAGAIGLVFGAPAIILKLTSGGVSGNAFCKRQFVDAAGNTDGAFDPTGGGSQTSPTT